MTKYTKIWVNDRQKFLPDYKAISRTAFDKQVIKNSVKFKCIESTPIKMFYDSG